MAKNAVSDWSATAASNTDIGGINLGEGVMAMSSVNDAIREVMAQIATAGFIGTTSPALAGTPTYAGSTSGTTGLKASAVASGTLTLPAATDTLVGRATTDTLTNKTLTSPTITTPTLTLKQSTTPAPTTEGDIQWDTDDNVLAIGDGAATQLFLPIPASTAAGDIEYFTGAKVKARLAKGSNGQVLTLASGVPSWAAAASSGQPIPTSSTFAVGDTCVAGFSATNSVADGSTVSGTALSQIIVKLSGASTGQNVAAAEGGALSGTWKNISGVTISYAGAAYPYNYAGRFVRTA